MRGECADYQSDSTCEEHDHYNRAEQTRCPEINVKIHQNAGNDDYDADEQEQPTGYGFAVEEQDADTDDEWNQRQAEHAVPTQRPEATHDHDAICDQVGSGYHHGKAEKELSNPARRTTRTSNSRFFVHGVSSSGPECNLPDSEQLTCTTLPGSNYQ